MLHNIIDSVHFWRQTKYSTRLIFTTPWSTPCGHYFMPYGVLHMVVLLPYGVLHMAEFEGHMECFIMLWKVFIYEELQSAPQDLSLQPHGVLHVVTISCHMECFILLPCQLWKRCKDLHKTCFQCSREYYIWPWITAIWHFSGAIWSAFQLTLNEHLLQVETENFNNAINSIALIS